MQDYDSSQRLMTLRRRLRLMKRDLRWARRSAVVVLAIEAIATVVLLDRLQVLELPF